MAEHRRTAMSGRHPGEHPEVLWQMHRRWVAAILLAHMPRELDVEDLLQEVAVRFVRESPKLSGPEAVKPWLRTVAVNLARTAGRRRSVRRAAFPRRAGPAPEPVDDGADDAREDRERGRLALELARQLPEDYREPLILKSLRGMSYRQIADVLGVPVTTVETRLVRARRMLREAVEQAEAESARGTTPTKRERNHDA